MNNDNCTVKNNQKKRHHAETHGMSSTGTYISWQSMKGRCHNKNNSHYYNYGFRGIEVCDRWLCSFSNFVNDMGNRPEGFSIDRIDNDKGYNKANCRWATSSEQNHNQRIRSNNKTGVTGIWFDKIRFNWQAQIKVNKKRIRLGLHNSFLDACCARKSAENKVNNL